MKPISLDEICQATGATLKNAGSPPDLMISGICTDTRRMETHSLFIALTGDNFDGHAFLEKAAAAGAVAAIVDRSASNAPSQLPLLLVDNARAAMGRLARHLRLKLDGKVIAVAGSNGKTSTKYLIDSVLRPDLAGTFSPKSFNNDVGVPLSIFPAEPGQDYLVLEIGTNHPGEVRTLTHIALPDIGVITNCNAEHLEGLGDLAGVRRENASLLEGIRPDGLLILNGDDPQLRAATQHWRGRRLTFGFSPANDLRATSVECSARGTSFVIPGISNDAFVPLLGMHSAANALAAIAVGREMGLPDAAILRNLAAAKGPDMRLQLQDAHGVTVLNDAYNANPASMKAAIQTLAALPTTGRRIAIVGDMRELGESSADLHREMGRHIATQFPPDLLICVGEDARMIAGEAVNSGLKSAQVEHFANASAAGAIVRRLREGDLVLLKASRAIGLESVAKAIFDGRSEPFAAAS